MGFFHQYEVGRDERVMDKMLNIYMSFWENCIEKKEPPPAKTEEDVRAMIKEPAGEVVASEEIERISSERKLLKEEIKQAQTHVKEMNKQLLEYMADKMEEGDISLDDDNTEKCVLVNDQGFKLNSYNGKQFR